MESFDPRIRDWFTSRFGVSTARRDVFLALEPRHLAVFRDRSNLSLERTF